MRCAKPIPKQLQLNRHPTRAMLPLEASYIEKIDPMKNLSLANTERQRAVRARAPLSNIPIIELLYVNSDRITLSDQKLQR